MRAAILTLTALFTSAAAVAQGPQPYNPQDPSNYGSPAAQSYYASNPQQYQQQPQQGQYPQQNQAPRYDPNAYSQQDDRDYQSGQQALQQVDQAPPPLPQYDQPEAPGDGYIWTPGYWAYGNGGYYWVQGSWVEPPYENALWTPGYWGYGDDSYFWNAGYWGPTIGFYGGINYGFGYFGTGFYGGYWNSGRFFYNREYCNYGRYGRFGYNQRYPGIHVHPGGVSFAHVDHIPSGVHPANGSFNQRGFAGNYNHTAPVQNGFRGTQSSQPGNYNRAAPAQGFAGQPHTGYPQPGYTSHYGATPSSGYSQPTYRSQPTQSFQGGSNNYHPAPSNNGGGGGSYHSAPSGGGGGSHYSAPSGGGGAHSAPSGGGGRGHR